MIKSIKTQSGVAACAMALSLAAFGTAQASTTIEGAVTAVLAVGSEVHITMDQSNSCGSSVYIADTSTPIGVKAEVAAIDALDLGRTFRITVGACQGDKALITGVG